MPTPTKYRLENLEAVRSKLESAKFPTAPLTVGLYSKNANLLPDDHVWTLDDEINVSSDAVIVLTSPVWIGTKQEQRRIVKYPIGFTVEESMQALDAVIDTAIRQTAMTRAFALAVAYLFHGNDEAARAFLTRRCMCEFRPGQILIYVLIKDGLPETGLSHYQTAIDTQDFIVFSLGNTIAFDMPTSNICAAIQINGVATPALSTLNIPGKGALAHISVDGSPQFQWPQVANLARVQGQQAILLNAVRQAQEHLLTHIRAENKRLYNLQQAFESSPVVGHLLAGIDDGAEGSPRDTRPSNVRAPGEVTAATALGDFLKSVANKPD